MASFSSRFVSTGLIFWVIFAIVGSWMLYPLRKKLKFGIDLVGGTYITLRVQVDKAVESELKEKYREISQELSANSSLQPSAHKIKDNKLIITFNSNNDANLAKANISNVLNDTESSVEGSNLVVKFVQKYEDNLKKWAVESDIDVLRTRLNSLGIEEIKVAPQGDTDIVVELPDIKDINKAKEMIGKPANLEFKLVEAMAASKAEIKDKFGGDIPSGYEILPYVDAKTTNGGKVYALVEEFAEVSGKHLKQVNHQVGRGKVGEAEAVVEFHLTSQGAKKFAELTSENIGKQLAIVLDGKVISAPSIRSAIPNGKGNISGGFTIDSAKELATLLKSGAFVAPVTFEEERTVGPALGYEAIRSGVVACTVGMALLFVFSLVVYKLSGLLAFLALLYNLFLLIFSMYLLKATLTLPGIAGMVLTIGMAIDSSILIFERVRELLAEGEHVKPALNKGFKGALAVILDANITTFITGLVLFYFGTGPVKGFAVTLMIGIIATLISGLFFLKTLFNAFLSKSGIQKLSI